MASLTQLELVFVLMVGYQLKHFLCDYPLQVEYMLRKGEPGWSFFIPLATHCLVHGGFTLVITFLLKPNVWWLALVDFFAHFIMDRVKSGPKYLGRFSDKEASSYWNCFGLDQMVHHLTHIYIVWVLTCGYESLPPA